MEFTFPLRSISLRVADSWTARPIAGGVVAHPKELAAFPADQVPTSVFVKVHHGSDLMVVAMKSMRPRACAGGQEAATLSMHGKEALAFEWTDGILDIASVFVAVRPGRILELTFAAEPERTARGIRPRRVLRQELEGFVDIAYLIEQ